MVRADKESTGGALQPAGNGGRREMIPAAVAKLALMGWAWKRPNRSRLMDASREPLSTTPPIGQCESVLATAVGSLQTKTVSY